MMATCGKLPHLMLASILDSFTDVNKLGLRGLEYFLDRAAIPLCEVCKP
jgi:hypothetical protein